ncbi:hypothetical protein N7471_005111 [Penicillium samsonianum]|uniref:uncharacterized protein n=1 Tax=Penicillium samsonianum TaxID=1882272 RepID=UPI002548C7BB|nr:uncharacterized protein N7471_005111 [Penicillium samsonianum]KAJ6138625.1 hypothetical protein N7471_005111 [Penicillium samsonianum]
MFCVRWFSGHWHAPGKPHDAKSRLNFLSISFLGLSSFTAKVAGAAVTTITNPQNLTSLFITHDQGSYPWSFCFMLGICVSR